MYLSKLELFGFKSFANKTSLDFTKGLTGIVGPNGCGKTNIVDAIRWCLGEQKSSTLRSDKMENVIFNGTRAKKPLGMSEVSMTFVNDNGQLPSEYSEVTITRRIFRSGESEYLLNKNVCRLKDITNLFMDTGMGTNAYSVIELKMIETILSSKQEERRRLFEEAAGVNKYKLRRRHTLKKLDDVRADLTRVNDIVSEVEKSVRSLERQAKKADKYQKIREELKEKELGLAERKFTLYGKQIEEYRTAGEQFLARRKELDESLKAQEEVIGDKKEKVNEIEKELHNKMAELAVNNEQLHEIQRSISVAREREKSLEKNLARFRSELDEYHYQEDEAADQLNLFVENLRALELQLAEREEEVNSLKEEIDAKKEALETKKAELKSRNDEELKKYKEITEEENNLRSLNNSYQALLKNIERHEESIRKQTEDIARTVGYLEDLGVEKEETEQKLKAHETLYAERKQEKEELEKKLSRLKDEELEAKNSLNKLQNKIEFLQSLITNLEGVSKGSKELIESDAWTEKEKTLFADVGSAVEEYRYALESSLKNVLNNLLIEDTEDLKKAIDYLKNNELGKASFFLVNNAAAKKSLLEKLREFRFKRKVKQIEREEEFIDWAYSFVKTEDKWKEYFQQALYNNVVTKNLEDALSLANRYPEFVFATLEGDIVFNNGVIEAGSLPNLDETLFGRKQLLESLQEEYPGLEENLKNLRSEIEETEEKLGGIDLDVLSDKGKLLLNDINNLEKQVSQFEYEKNKLNEEIEKARSEISELTGETKDLDERIEAGKLSVAGKKEEKERSEEALKAFEAELAAVEKEYSESVAVYNQKKLELERHKGQVKNTKNSLESTEGSKERIKKSIEKRTSDIENTEQEIVTIKNIIEEKEYEYDEVYDIKKGLEEERGEIQGTLNEIKSEYLEMEKGLKQERTERDEISERIHNIDLKVNDIIHKNNTLVEHIKEEYSMVLEKGEFEDLESFDYNSTEKEVHTLKEQIKNLGPVNLLAYSEYEEEKERLDFLHAQRDDLVDSEKDLMATIKEINNTAQTKFRETFEEVKQNFKNIFQTLFDPGDEADLILEEDVDPLDAKIDIMAKPKGKRPTSIELLSGGEKTLTATALLFAIYLVKPSPFCILDEVDAPLDDANVDRFTNLLREFSNNTQFIIVTHNKRTMEAAETMYGVTMQEEGISKLASVRFTEDLPVD